MNLAGFRFHKTKTNATPAPSAPPLRHRHRVLKYGGAVALLLVILLVAARLALPSYLQSYVNGVLDESPQYDGSVGKVTVHLYRGAYSIDQVNIVKTTGNVPVPFFEAQRLDFSVDWRALLDGGIRAKVLMDHPKLHFVQGPTTEDSQTGEGQPWLSMIKDLSPFRIDKTRIIEGEVYFHAFHKKPEVNIYLSNLNAEMLNLTNVKDSSEPLVATVHATGRAMQSGNLEFNMSLDPQAHYPTFDLALKLLDLDVTQLNDLARAYGDFDFESGQFDFVLEASTKNGYMLANAKPLFRNATVISLRDVKQDNPLQLFWESIVGAVGAVFTNQSRQQFGTSITLEGDLENPQTSILEIVGNVLRNAFIRAYLPRIEGRIAPDVARPQDEQDYDPKSRSRLKASSERSRTEPR